MSSQIDSPLEAIEEAPARAPAEHGFSLIELLIALTVLMVGMVGILQVHVVAINSSSYSRHMTEAAILGEDKVEQLRTMPVTAILGGTETVNSQGKVVADGPFTRNWTIVWTGNIATITVTVTWLERGADPHRVVMRSQRSL